MTSETTKDAGAVAAAVEQLKGEHARMRELLDRVASSKDLEALAPILQELHTQLKRHFAREEYPGGLYDSMGACVPEFRHSIRKLVDDHFRLLATARTLAARAADAGEAGRDAVLSEVIELVEWVKAHEALEHEIAGAAQRRASS